jgi:hypothetical protein
MVHWEDENIYSVTFNAAIFRRTPATFIGEEEARSAHDLNQ